MSIIPMNMGETHRGKKTSVKAARHPPATCSVADLPGCFRRNPASLPPPRRGSGARDVLSCRDYGYEVSADLRDVPTRRPRPRHGGRRALRRQSSYPVRRKLSLASPCSSSPPFVQRSSSQSPDTNARKIISGRWAQRPYAVQAN